jgi:hypothetical protein
MSSSFTFSGLQLLSVAAQSNKKHADTRDSGTETMQHSNGGVENAKKEYMVHNMNEAALLLYQLNPNR